MRRRSFVTTLLATPFVSRAHASTYFKSDLELWAGLDKSGSMVKIHESSSFSHWDIQLNGHVQAFQDVHIRQALLDRQTHLRVVAWASITLDFAYEGVLRTPDDVDAAIEAMERLPGAIPEYPTYPSYVLERMLKTTPVSRKRVLDISLDQVIDHPREVARIKRFRRQLEHLGTRINVLSIGESLLPRAQSDYLSELLQTQTPGSFTYSVGWSPTEYTQGIKRKLQREILS